MDYFAKGRILDRFEQFLLKDLVVRQLVLWHMDNDHADLKPGEVLLKLKTLVDRHEDVKFILGNCEERSILQCIPTLLVNGGDIVVTKYYLDTRVYALVNEDAHSKSWLLAKSSTARTCSRVIEG